MKKKVIIVKEGELESAAYDSWLKIIGDATEMNGKGESEIVNSVDDALVKIKQGYINTLVFISESMLDQADKIQDSHSLLRVVLFASHIPRERPILIDKGWSLSLEQIQQIVVGS